MIPIDNQYHTTQVYTYYTNQFDYESRQLLQSDTMHRVKNDEQRADLWNLKPKMIELIEYFWQYYHGLDCMPDYK